jgi:predicted HTH transcriptional regulator
MKRRQRLADQVDGSAAAATVAVMRGARTVREVAEACGWSSSSTAFHAIQKALDLDLIEQIGFDENGKAIVGTLRPLLEGERL